MVDVTFKVLIPKDEVSVRSKSLVFTPRFLKKRLVFRGSVHGRTQPKGAGADEERRLGIDLTHSASPRPMPLPPRPLFRTQGRRLVHIWWEWQPRL